MATAGGVVAGSWAGCASAKAPVVINGNDNGGGSLVALIADPADPVVTAPAAQWGLEQLRGALAQRGFDVHLVTKPEEAPLGARCIMATGGTAQVARDAGASTPLEAESLAITPGRLGAREILVASGADGRGLMYALTEIADAIALGGDTRAALNPSQAVVERPANAVRSVLRMFVSDVEDKQWYNDRDFWRNYLTMLASQRFNRFNLSFGLGYDAPSGLRDTYLYFAYPFLLNVPGYDVKAVGLPDGERDSNLAMLRFISDEAAARGLQFQLGLWTHAYEWTNSPNANYNISGLTPQTQAPYSRDALAIILKECPGITGVTFRIHGESGVPEGSYDLWKMIFDGCVRSGRRIEIDMHAKGMDQPTIDAALGTGLPVTISPKFSAEHMGLPYHQAAIRPTEMPTRTRGGGAFAQSNGARSFLRYSYGDLLTEDRKYGVFHRIWPGTQRLLLWGDPVFAAGYSRAGSFCGSLGHEIFDPLGFKGRKGTGLPGGRDGYADLTMRARGGDFEKYRYSYRVWGRLLYNPETPAQGWRRQLEREFDSASGAVEVSLARASRILPLITTAHLPSAANAIYWPEMYTNMSIIDATRSPYTDTPSPKRFGTVSPLDPQLFSRIDDYADELLQGPPGAKYSPIEVAQWLEDLAASADDEFGLARERQPDRRLTAYRRYAADVAAQIALGRFFGKKIRAGVLYALHERTGDPDALNATLKVYRQAREIWRVMANSLVGVYVPDLTFGDAPSLRGHWSDRLAAIDSDIDILDERASNVLTAASGNPQYIPVLIATAQGRPNDRPAPGVGHLPPASFRRGQPLTLDLVPLQDGTPLPQAQLYYRHADQAETWNTLPMTRIGDGFRTEIPGEYTNTSFALIYYFALRDNTGQVAIYPGFNSTLANQPYFVLRQAT